MSSARIPFGHASLTSWIPLQNDPKAIQGAPLPSITSAGSIALYESNVCETSTAPRSTQRYPEAEGSSVVFVASPIAEWLEPNVDAA